MSPSGRWIAASILSFGLSCLSYSGAVQTSSERTEGIEGESPPARVPGITERVEVQLILVDVVVLDRQDRTVSDLTADDFEVLIDYRPVAIESVDIFCSEGGATDPLASEDWSNRTAPDEGAAPRKIVLAFDYVHMDQAETNLALKGARAALHRLQLGGEEHMIVSIHDDVRVHLPFTTDRDAVRVELAMMRKDVALYARHVETLTEFPSFDKIEALLDVLQIYPGRKVVVLFSAPYKVDQFDHDLAYRRVASLAARSRAAIYTVDSRGLISDRRREPLGGDPNLARLATETGGRFTDGANDLSLAYARAQRDVSCMYTLGFRDSEPKEDQDRLVTVVARRDTRVFRVIHPTSYVVRSRAARMRDHREAAEMAPELFRSPALTATVEPVIAKSSKSWEVRLAVAADLSREPAAVGGPGWHLKAMLRRRNGTIIWSAERDLDLDASVSTRLEASIEGRKQLGEGKYLLSGILTHPDIAEPMATVESFDLPFADGTQPPL